MGPLLPVGKSAGLLAILSFTICAAYPQTLPHPGQCQVTAVPAQVRAEGLTEPMGDILLQCSGSNPGAVLSGNLSVFLPVSITNRVDANNLTQDVTLSVNYGNGFVPTGVSGLITNQIIAFNGIGIVAPTSGNFSIKISNIRAAVYQNGVVSPQPIQAQLTSGSPQSIQVNQSQVVVAFPQPSFAATLYSTGIACVGSPLPPAVTLTNLFAAGTAFASTRLTEEFGSAFLPRGSGDDSGVRFLIAYSGFPSNAQLFVPDRVAGSSALVPTAGGDLGVPQSVGQYLPGSASLLLVRVQGADATGAGGTPVQAPTGVGPVLLDSVSPVALSSSGSGYAVYEVANSNPNLIESAQFPTFIGLASVNAAALAQESVSLAPVSTVPTASITAPVPRFAAVPPASDCRELGDCGANYFPKLSVDASPVQLTGVSGGAMTSQPGYIIVNNAGGGILEWTAALTFQTGSGWARLDYTSGVNNGSIRVFALPQALAAGTYQASVAITGAANTVTVPVTLTVAAAPPPPPPPAPTVVVTGVVNAATFQVTPLVAGSLGTAMGQGLTGKIVSLTLNGMAASLSYTSATQINFVVPPALASQPSATLVVTVDGISSAPETVSLTGVWPEVFARGVLNQDYSENTSATPAQAGSILQIWGTGIADGAIVSAQIAGRTGLVPLYSGAAPGVSGVQQVNVAIPADAPSGPTQLVLCATAGSAQHCSAGYPIDIQ